MNNNDKETLNNKRSFISVFNKGFERWMPDSLTICLFLFVIVVILAIVLTDAPLIKSTETKTSIVDSMGDNFWSLLTFSMQMVFMIVCGNTFANSPPIKKFLRRMCNIPNNMLSAYVFCAGLAAILSWFHWGIGFMGGILIGKEMLATAHRKGFKLNMPGFIALVWCASMLGSGGISQSQVLFAATPDYLKSLVSPEWHAMMQSTYTVQETMVNARAIGQTIGTVILSFAVIWFMRPRREEDYIEIDPALAEEFSQEIDTKNFDCSTPRLWMENSRFFVILTAIPLTIWSVKFLIEEGFFGISIDSFNFILLTVTLIACGRPSVFLKLCVESISSTWAFVVQFPFYAGIFGIIVGSGLDQLIVNLFLQIANEDTWASIACLYSAILNLFVPSSGSKFIIEAPYIIPTTFQLNGSIPSVLLAYGYGDLATNLILPFWWILPCGLYKIQLHKVLGYALIISAVVLVFDMIALYVLW